MAVSQEKSVRVRFAPSPTGPLHIGGARTALFNWLFARGHGGSFILRIEDTDTERSEKKYESEIFDGLKWLGLLWDEGPSTTFASKSGAGQSPQNSKLKIKSYVGDYGPYRQSERIKIYKKYLEKLLEEGAAYYCYCTKEELEAERQAMLAQGLPPKYSGHCRNIKKPPVGKMPQVIRFKMPETEVEFKDIIRGKVSFDASLFGDSVIAKNLELPLYNFAVVVDDAEMEITHVIRGEEHLSNTPKQILMQKAMRFEKPEYAHLPLILNPDRSKMSKRFADTALLDYKKQGYLPGSIINFLALMGWHPKDVREVFTLSELVREFDLKRAQKSGAVFNQEKLDWLQKEHLKNLSTEEIVSQLMPTLTEKKITVQKELLQKIIQIERPRLKSLNEFMDLAGFFFKLPNYDTELLIWQNEPVAKIKTMLANIAGIIKNIELDSFNREIIVSKLSAFIEKGGRGTVLWPLRVALSGQTASPDPLEIMEILGRKETVARIKIALEKLDTL